MKIQSRCAATLIVMLFITSIATAAEGFDQAIPVPGLRDIQELHLQRSASYQSAVDETSNLVDEIAELGGFVDEEERARASIDVTRKAQEHFEALKIAQTGVKETIQRVLQENRDSAEPLEVDPHFDAEMSKQQVAFFQERKQALVESIAEDGASISDETRRFVRDMNQMRAEKEAFLNARPDHLRTILTTADVRGFLEVLGSNLQWINHHLFITEGLADMLDAARFHRTSTIVGEARVTSPAFNSPAELENTYAGLNALSGEPEMDRKQISDEALYNDPYKQ